MVPSVVLSITKSGHPFRDAGIDTHFMNNAVGIAIAANFVTKYYARPNGDGHSFNSAMR